MARIMARDLKTKSLKKQRSEPPGWTALRKKTTQRVWLIAARRADARTLGAVCLPPTGTQDPPPASPSRPRRLREMKTRLWGAGVCLVPSHAYRMSVRHPPKRNVSVALALTVQMWATAGRQSPWRRGQFQAHPCTHPHPRALRTV